MNISQQSVILKDNLEKYYKNDKHFNIVYDMLINPKISLRVIDWFVTNYSKKYNIIFDNIDKKSKVNVYNSYKSQLKSYSKKYFDPFCRRERIRLENENKTKEIVTTYGQLNFFKWYISNNIIDYIDINYNNIEKDMNESICIHNKKKSKNSKRKELSKSSYNKLNVVDIKTTLYFD